jgi:hypothetical protein
VGALHTRPEIGRFEPIRDNLCASAPQVANARGSKYSAFSLLGEDSVPCGGRLCVAADCRWQWPAFWAGGRKGVAGRVAASGGVFHDAVVAAAGAGAAGAGGVPGKHLGEVQPFLSFRR